MDIGSRDKILTDDEISWESRKLGALYGFSALFVASVFGSRALSLGSKANAFSSAATGAVTGYMWSGFTRQAYEKRRRQLIEESQKEQQPGASDSVSK
ncbi:hypothetical protein DL89DRAFT_2863 [Linderina pennispora]|uniref:Uncharacterized protein n=1 Tax=Linderina pennispora TaxID=61395 RepID=A0A1Y1WJF5_9FUNG|nr:uncharacterized protein DL89DRAFT_2863 [Linderina pennispora]KAJ1958517.1 hypothetical protein EC988_000257 [Linderina pennispora]ORX73711.1 hypothetical protein DL89DRAFT_2863 [Linderina pennispora]